MKETSHVYNANCVSGYWVGATDRYKEGHFTWLNGLSVTHYIDNWDDGEPNSRYHDEDCMELYQKVGWKWNDETCSTHHLFICEK